MAKYSKLNFNDIENSSKTDGVEALFSRSKIGSTDIGVSMFHYPPNFKAEKGHSHKVQEEVYVVMNGSGSILIDDEVIDLKLWDVVRVEPTAVRAFSAGSAGLDIIACGGPKPDGGDGLMADVIWPN
jgi:uncharacterized cupin superfamily protein